MFSPQGPTRVRPERVSRAGLTEAQCRLSSVIRILHDSNEIHHTLQELFRETILLFLLPCFDLGG